MREKSLLLTLAVLLSVSAIAQSWSWALPLDGEGTESTEAVAHTANGGFAVGGSFRGTIELEGWSATAAGGTDAFLAYYGPGQDLQWAISGGDSENDNISSLVALPDGGLLCAGSYWFEITLGDSTLMADVSPRTLFTARFSAEGVLEWVRQYPGEGLKEIEDIAVLSDGSIALAGFYERTLQIADTLLESGTLDETTYCFTALLNADGQLQWVQQGGQNGATRARALALLPDNGIAIGGYFDDTTSIAGEVLTANSHDRDAFLAAYSNNGAPLWARKAGGVIDEELLGLDSDSEGNLYATGYMIGVMTLSEAISIQTNNGNSNFFILKYNAQGEPQWGRSLGGTSLQGGEAIVAQDGLIALSGYFQEQMAFDGFQVDAGATPDAFIAGFNQDGEARWLATIPSDGFSLANALAINNARRILVGGSFRETASFDQLDFNGEGNSTAFVGQLWPAFTSTEEPGSSSNAAIKVYPNPVRDTLFFEFAKPIQEESLFLCLYNSNGQPVRCREVPDISDGSIYLSVNGIPAGVYQWIGWQGKEQIGSGSVIIQ